MYGILTMNAGGKMLNARFCGNKIRPKFLKHFKRDGGGVGKCSLNNNYSELLMRESFSSHVQHNQLKGPFEYSFQRSRVFRGKCVNVWRCECMCCECEITVS